MLALICRDPSAHVEMAKKSGVHPNNPGYLEWALHYSRPGTVIIGDNVVREGEVINGQSDDARVQGVRRFIEMIGDNPRLTATALQTVGVKGWDGFTLAMVNG